MHLFLSNSREILIFVASVSRISNFARERERDQKTKDRAPLGPFLERDKPKTFPRIEHIQTEHSQLFRGFTNLTPLFDFPKFPSARTVEPRAILALTENERTI